MAAKSRSRNRSSFTRNSRDSASKDRLIAELNNRIAVLENELNLKVRHPLSHGIADREMAEDALRESEERDLSLVEKTGDWVWETDAGFALTYNSPKMRDIMGYEPEEVLGRSPFEFMLEDELERMKSIAWPAIARHEPIQRVENRLIRKDGSVAFIETTGIPLFDDSGHYRGYRGVNRDITERKRAEAELLQKLTEIEAIFKALPDIYFRLSDEGVFLDYHAGSLSNLYVRPGQFLGKTIEDVLPPEIAAIFRQEIRNTMATGELRIVEYTMPMQQGFQDYEARLMPLTGDELIVVIRNITNKKESEKALREAKAQVELYLDLMGHDINNMHQIALGYLELARDMYPDADRNALLDKPIEVLQRSARLIKNVRKLQKLKDGVFQAQEVDVCKILRDLQREFGAVPHKAITLNINECEQCLVYANELLYDVFANLVSNAIKHTGDRAEVVISLEMVDEGSRYCRVTVEDNGPGIPDDFKGKIFDRMLKSTSKAKGMGLGLYLVKSLVESYDGRVWVEDRVPGDHTKGARFAVMLPMIE
ncbi:MAG: aerobic respiration control sensor protein ArcB [Methanocella sp. PtaU1.Bin125]|nr:MAG: aerobic respiration control sensor protein ArcB [Methanocella sp. PtaU1.Bin125]